MNEEMTKYVESTGKSLRQLLDDNLSCKNAYTILMHYMELWPKSHLIDLLSEEIYEMGSIEDLEGME
tara:strand:+ start:3374 stop:3574 length:201 start_codon:yes stop_codon:yes gene_type:complete